MLVLVLVPVSQAIPPAFPVTSSSTGVMIPLYSFPGFSPYPGANWQPVIKSHNGYPKVPMVATINENSGYPVNYDSNFAGGVANLQKAGIIVLGYVFTHYDCTDAPASCSKGTVPAISLTEAEMKNYSDFYHVNGTLFDEMSTNASNGNLTYYGTLNNYAKNTLHEILTVGNPGTQTNQKFNGTFNNLIVWENTALPPVTSYSSWDAQYDKKLFSILAFSTPSSKLNQTYINNTSNHVGYLYFTDDGPDGNPWDELSTYLNSTLQMLNFPSILLKTQSVDLYGKPFTGMYTVISQSGNTIRTGYTTLVLNGTSGFPYNVNAQNFGSYKLDHWDGGSKSAFRNTTPTQNTNLTAYYTTPQKITIQTKDLSGNTLTGINGNITRAGVLKSSGTTPFSYSSAISNTTYTVTMNTNSSYSFDHWDVGYKSNVRAVAPLNGTLLTAFYNTHATNGTQSTWSVTINSRNLLGWVNPKPPNGVFEQIYYAGNGTLKTSGYTPLTFTASNNVKYKVVSTLSFQQKKFDHWDGFTNSSNIRYITPVSNMNLFAYYTAPVNLTIQSVNSAGYPITGYYTVIYNSTGIEKTGFTPLTYAVASNRTYTVNVQNFGGVNFNHWDIGYTNANRTLAILSNATITAYYTP